MTICPDTSIYDGRAFLAAAVEAGLAGITYPAEYGGAGLTTAHDKIWREEKGRFPTQDGEFVISHGMCLPMLSEWGTAQSRRRNSSANNIAGRTMWCQLFSEPGAGSDVASLQIRADRDGDEWILNGQKVWTTVRPASDFGPVVARTDPRPAKARRSVDVHPRHACARRRDPADPPDRRRDAISTRCSSPTSVSRPTGPRRPEQRLAHGDEPC